MTFFSLRQQVCSNFWECQEYPVCYKCYIQMSNNKTKKLKRKARTNKYFLNHPAVADAIPKSHSTLSFWEKKKNHQAQKWKNTQRIIQSSVNKMLSSSQPDCPDHILFRKQQMLFHHQINPLQFSKSASFRISRVMQL